jgi:hypothetical protein
MTIAKITIPTRARQSKTVDKLWSLQVPDKTRQRTYMYYDLYKNPTKQDRGHITIFTSARQSETEDILRSLQGPDKAKQRTYYDLYKGPIKQDRGHNYYDLNKCPTKRDRVHITIFTRAWQSKTDDENKNSLNVLSQKLQELSNMERYICHSYAPKEASVSQLKNSWTVN